VDSHAGVRHEESDALSRDPLLLLLPLSAVACACLPSLSQSHAQIAASLFRRR
jgi:hypothetical protein